MIQSAKADLTCPLCGHSMGTSQRQNVEIDQCARCEAVFFDAGELTQAEKGVDHLDEVGMRKAAAQQDPTDIAHTCPRCQEGMQDVILIDETSTVLSDDEAIVRACTGCHGLLLDANALTRAHRFDGLRPYGQVKDKDDVGPGVRLLEKALSFLEGLVA